MLGIDTFSWGKMIYLKNNGWKKLIQSILDDTNIFITHEVFNELSYRFLDEKSLFSSITIFPKLDISFNYYRKLGFDDADASLLEYSEQKGWVIISEDNEMLAQGITKRANIIQLGDYFGFLLLNNYLSSREFQKIIKTLRKLRNITKRKEKELLNLRTRLY